MTGKFSFFFNLCLFMHFSLHRGPLIYAPHYAVIRVFMLIFFPFILFIHSYASDLDFHVIFLRALVRKITLQKKNVRLNISIYIRKKWKNQSEF